MKNKKPNIIFIMTDQQSAEMMSCAGNADLKTPAMDYLAQNGVRFTRAYCANPVCVPSRFSLMTGRMPSYIGLKCNADWLDNKIDEIPKHIFTNGIGKLFKKAGYDAVYGGKVHLPGFNVEEIGFDLLTGDSRGELAKTCSDYIREHDKEKPFFMVASFVNPHDICYMALADYHNSQGDKDIFKNIIDYKTLKKVLKDKNKFDEANFYENICPSLPDNFEPQKDEPEAIKELINQRLFRKYAREKYSKKRWKLHRWAYCRLTEMVDKKISIVIKALKESGIEEDTLIIFSSDHGDHDGAHKLEHKSTHYEEVSRVPFIITQKGETKAGVVDNSHLINNGLDLIPTICDYARIEHPEKDLEGRSIKPLLEGEKIEWRDAVKVESEFGQGVITDRYKYVLYNQGKNNEQLYDLTEKPREMRNALNDEGKQEVVKKMKKKFLELYEEK